MAWTLTADPISLGSKNGALITLTNDGVNSNNSVLAITPSQLRMANILAVVSEFNGSSFTVGGNKNWYIAYDRTLGNLEVWSGSLGGRAGSTDAFLSGQKVYALAIGA